MSWRDSAACVGKRSIMWPNGEAPFSRTEIREAKAVCASCPVASQCLEDALSISPRPSGVWGGTTAEERKGPRVRRWFYCERCGERFSAQATAKFCSHACQQAVWVQRNRRVS